MSGSNPHIIITSDNGFLAENSDPDFCESLYLYVSTTHTITVDVLSGNEEMPLYNGVSLEEWSEAARQIEPVLLSSVPDLEEIYHRLLQIDEQCYQQYLFDNINHFYGGTAPSRRELRRGVR